MAKFVPMEVAAVDQRPNASLNDPGERVSQGVALQDRLKGGSCLWLAHSANSRLTEAKLALGYSDG